MSIDDCLCKARCSGCVPEADRFKMFERASGFFKQNGFQKYELMESLSTAFRTRSKLAVRRASDFINIGLFRTGTHEVISIPGCLAHHHSINRVVSKVEVLPAVLGYDEKRQIGDLRYLQCTVQRQTGYAQVVFVLNCSRTDEVRRRRWLQIAQKFHAEEGELFRSVYLNYQSETTNRILGDDFELVCGDAFLYENILGICIPIGPGHFIQANLGMFESLLKDLIGYVENSDQILELYAGMGIISLVVSPYCSSILAVEKERGAKESFEYAVKQLPFSSRNKLSFCVADADESVDRLSTYNSVILDPPRKGLSSMLVASLIKAGNIEKIFYISCWFPSLQRDLERLLEGGFSVVFARSYRFFPGTDHIETLVVLKRKKSG